MDYISFKDCGEKGQYSGNSELSTKTKLKQDVESLINMNQEKSANKPPGGGYQKALVNVKEYSQSIIMGDPTK